MHLSCWYEENVHDGCEQSTTPPQSSVVCKQVCKCKPGVQAVEQHRQLNNTEQPQKFSSSMFYIHPFNHRHLTISIIINHHHHSILSNAYVNVHMSFFIIVACTKIVVEKWEKQRIALCGAPPHHTPYTCTRQKTCDNPLV